MDKPVCYAGVDVGKEELWVAIAGRRPRMFTHSPQGIRALVRFCRTLAPDHRLHVCLEATGPYGRSLAVRLLGSGDSDLQVSIINPAQIAAFAKAQLRRTKTDAVDARVILAFAQSQTPPPWEPEPPALRELMQLVQQADTVQITLQAWQNRAASHAIVPDSSRVVQRTDRAMIRTLQREWTRLQEAITALCQTDAHLRQQVDLLRSIPGVGDLTAVRLLAYGGTAWMTHSARQLTAHAGLAPRHHCSGTSVRGRSRLDKQGKAALRRTLFWSAMNGVQHNPRLRTVRQRLLGNGKTKMLTITACMRHLLLIVRAMLRTQQPFRPVATVR